MAFNLGAFLGGAVDQYNTEEAKRQRQQQIDQQAAEQNEQIASLQQEREQRAFENQRKRQELEADDAMNSALAQNLAKVGQTPTVETQTPALLKAPEAQAEAPAQTPSAPAVPPANASAALPTGVGVDAAMQPAAAPARKTVAVQAPGGTSTYLPSQALTDTAQWMMAQNVPAYSARAAKLMEVAQAKKGDEAWDMARAGDYGGAASHLFNKPTDVVPMTIPGQDGTRQQVLAMTDKESGKVLDVFKDGDDFLYKFAALRTPDTLSQYAGKVMANLQKQYETEQKARADDRRAADSYVHRVTELAKLGMKAQGGGSGGSGSSGRSGAEGGFMKFSDFNGLASKYVRDGQSFNSAAAYGLASRIRAANPGRYSPADAADLALKVAAGNASLEPFLNPEDGQWHEAVKDPATNQSVPTQRTVSPTDPQFIPAVITKDGKPLDGDELKAAQTKLANGNLSAAREREDAWLDSLKAVRSTGSTETDYATVQRLAKDPVQLSKIRQMFQSGTDLNGNPLTQADQNQLSRTIQGVEVLRRQNSRAVQQVQAKSDSKPAAPSAQARVDAAAQANMAPRAADTLGVTIGGAGKWIGSKVDQLTHDASKLADEETVDQIKQWKQQGGAMPVYVQARIRSRLKDSASEDGKRLILNELTPQEVAYIRGS